MGLERHLEQRTGTACKCGELPGTPRRESPADSLPGYPAPPRLAKTLLDEAPGAASCGEEARRCSNSLGQTTSSPRAEQRAKRCGPYMRDTAIPSRTLPLSAIRSILLTLRSPNIVVSQQAEQLFRLGVGSTCVLARTAEEGLPRRPSCSLTAVGICWAAIGQARACAARPCGCFSFLAKPVVASLPASRPIWPTRSRGVRLARRSPRLRQSSR
jgi:hypothetical protein